MRRCFLRQLAAQVTGGTDRQSWARSVGQQATAVVLRPTHRDVPRRSRGRVRIELVAQGVRRGRRARVFYRRLLHRAPRRRVSHWRARRATRRSLACEYQKYKASASRQAHRDRCGAPCIGASRSCAACSHALGRFAGVSPLRRRTLPAPDAFIEHAATSAQDLVGEGWSDEPADGNYRRAVVPGVVKRHLRVLLTERRHERNDRGAAHAQWRAAV